MLFKKLQMENFGIYKGKHSIDLTVEDGKPVILLGALNGAGKTTFLDAIQLVLYGKYAKCSNRASMSYSNFLASCNNHFASREERVRLCLSFSHQTENRVKHYDIERSWKIKSTEPKDKVRVLVDHEYDEYLSECWDDFVNEFIPLSLSDLFFFDGEKIEHLAHPTRSSELVRTGIESLLGLDLLSQLQIDLTQVDKKRRKSNVDQSTLKKLLVCEEEIAKHSAVISELRKEVADLEYQRSNVNLALNKSRQAMRDAGAHLIEKRDGLKFELGAVEAKLEQNKSERAKLAAGVGPLALVKDLIEQTKRQISLESEAAQAKALNESIHAYNEKILSTLEAAAAQKTLVSRVKKTMLQQEKAREQLIDVECYLNTDLSIFSGLDERIEQEEKQRQHLEKEEVQLLEKHALLQKQIGTIPSYESVQHILETLTEHEGTYKSLTNLITQKQQLLDQALAKDNALSQRYSNLLTKQNKDTFEQKRTIQVSEHVNKLKTTLKGFAEQLVSENIEYLQALVKQKFDTLGRKSKLINDLKICPTRFSITLFDKAGNPLEPGRLSAGERQLLAIAILWGLAEASGKELPTIIDTPLGRLDGKHRNRVINHYLPEAGPQVILLSTDEEIIGTYYKQLKPYIAREFKINFNEQEKTSIFEEGYF